MPVSGNYSNLAFSLVRLLERSRYSSREDRIVENFFSDSTSESDCEVSFDSSATFKKQFIFIGFMDVKKIYC